VTLQSQVAAAAAAASALTPEATESANPNA